MRSVLVLFEHETIHGARADDQADDRHQKADDEEDAPTPGREIFRAHQRFDEDYRAEAEQQPDRNGEADPGAPEGAIFRARRLLDHPGRGGAEFGAETDALAKPEYDQKDRRGDPDAVVGRGQPDQKRGDAHQHQRIDHGVFAAVGVGDIAEDESADRTDDDAEAVDADRGGNGGQAGQLEEDAAPDGRRDHAGDQEVVLLDHRADDAGERDLINLVGGRSCGRSYSDVAHFSPPNLRLSICADARASAGPMSHAGV